MSCVLLLGRRRSKMVKGSYGSALGSMQSYVGIPMAKDLVGGAEPRVKQPCVSQGLPIGDAHRKQLCT